ncbi:MAG: ABC transporter transmembrane domain-containing protein, partial [Pseudomonadota bacterium]
NLQRGILGERMLRRMRFDLFRRVMGRPLRRLKDTSPGELVQMISAELAPIGDFIGAIIVTPVAQGGSFIVYLSFIIAQNPLIGAAALALYPVQAYVIPKLQAKVVEMIRQRLANIRAMAREINESIDGATEVRALRARRWHMAIVNRQLYDNYKIRRRIFILKFLIKFVNNVANHLTPFFIFLIGGYFVIEGQLDIGALTAVLIAYKDLAAPWKELLRYYQDFSDMTARYQSVMENFDEDGEPAPLRDGAAVGPHALELSGARVDGFARPVSCHAPKGASVVVVGEDPSQRSALLQALSGLSDEGGETWRAGTPVLYRASAYVPGDPRIFSGTIRGNLLQGLMFRPFHEAEENDRAERQREAGLTGAPLDDTADDWVNPDEAGYRDAAEVEARMISLATSLGLEDDLYTIGLGSRLNADAEPRLAADLLEIRRRIAASEEFGEMRADFIDVWQEGAYNPNGTLGQNLFFAMPRDPEAAWADFSEDRVVLRALDAAGVKRTVVDLGVDLCDALVSLFEGVGADSDLFKRYSLFPRAETPVIEGILRKAKTRGADKLSRAEQSRMIAVAFSYSSARYRLGVMRAAGRAETLLNARPALREAIARDDRFVTLDPENYVAALSIADNVFFGPVKVDRRDSWGPFKSRVDTLLTEIDLRRPILRAGLDQAVGDNGATFNAAQRRKMGLARALMKNPGALVLDGMAPSGGAGDLAIRRLLRGLLEDGAGDAPALVWGAAGEDAAPDADHVIRILPDGSVSEGPPAGRDPEARAVDGG